MAGHLNVVRTPILVKGPRTTDGRRLLEDYGFCFISINDEGGVAFSDEYLNSSPRGVNDGPGLKDYYTAPITRESNFAKADEAFGFIS